MEQTDVLVEVESMSEKLFKRIRGKTPVLAVIVWLAEHVRVLVSYPVLVINSPSLRIREQLVRLLDFHKFSLGIWVTRFVRVPVGN